MDSNTLNVNSLNTNPALKMSGNLDTSKLSATPSPTQVYTSPAISPQASTIDIPTKISGDTLTYKAPTTTGIETPIDKANNALTATVDTYATQTATPPPELSDYDKQKADLMKGLELYTNKDTGYSATSAKLQQEAGLNQKQQELSALDVKDLALQKQQKDFENQILNQNREGLFGGAGQQAITQYQRDISSQRAGLAIQKLALQGDIKGATDMIKLKLDAQFEPITQRLDYLSKVNTIYNNDLTEKQKAQMTLEQKRLETVAKEKEDFKDIMDKALLNGASSEEIQNAYTLFNKGDRNGAISSIAKYGGTGALTPYQQFTTTQSLAKDVQKRTENAREMARQAKLITDSYNNILKKGDRSLNTQAIITSFNKILDPTSVVRESEYDRTAQGQALIEQLRGKVDQIASGGAGVTEQTLKEASDIAKTYLESSQDSINAENQRARAMAEQFGLQGDFVTSTYGATPTTTGTKTITVKGKVLPTDF